MASPIEDIALTRMEASSDESYVVSPRIFVNKRTKILMSPLKFTDSRILNDEISSPLQDITNNRSPRSITSSEGSYVERPRLLGNKKIQKPMSPLRFNDSQESLSSDTPGTRIGLFKQNFRRNERKCIPMAAISFNDSECELEKTDSSIDIAKSCFKIPKPINRQKINPLNYSRSPIVFNNTQNMDSSSDSLDISQPRNSSVNFHIPHGDLLLPLPGRHDNSPSSTTAALEISEGHLGELRFIYFH